MNTYAEPVIQYQDNQQRYTFPESTISAEIFFSEFSQYSGIDVYYYPGLIIPDAFRGASLQEDQLIRILDKKFSLIKSFKDKQLASIQILPEGQFKNGNLRHAGATLVEKSQSSDTLKEQPVFLSDQRIRVLKAQAKKEKALAKIQAKHEEKKEANIKRNTEKQKQREEKHEEKKQKKLSRLKKLYDTDKELYERQLPFYQNQFGDPDFSELNDSD
jgi:hypothetical protein